MSAAVMPSPPELPGELRTKIQAYRAVSREGKPTHQIRAEFERDIWRATPTAVRAQCERRPGDGPSFYEFVNRHLEFVVAYEAETRYTILNLGEEGAALWHALDVERMPIGRVKNVLRTMRNIRSQDENRSVADAIAEALKKHTVGSVVVETTSGKRYTRNTLMTKRAVDAAAGEDAKPKKERKKRAPKPSKTKATETNRRGRELATHIRTEVTDYFVQRVKDAGISPDHPEVLHSLTRIGIEIDTLTHGMNVTISRLVKTHASTKLAEAIISKRALEVAFQALNLEPPHKDEVVDLAEIRRQKHRMARLYHPDAHGGSTTTQEQYTAVIEAWDTIESWARNHPHLVKPERKEKEERGS